MRIACPSDPGLPRLPAALDGPYLAGLVQERLRALGVAPEVLDTWRILAAQEWTPDDEDEDGGWG